MFALGLLLVLIRAQDSVVLLDQRRHLVQRRSHFLYRRRLNQAISVSMSSLFAVNPSIQILIFLREWLPQWFSTLNRLRWNLFEVFIILRLGLDYELKWSIFGFYEFVYESWDFRHSSDCLGMKLFIFPLIWIRIFLVLCDYFHFLRLISWLEGFWGPLKIVLNLLVSWEKNYVWVSTWFSISQWVGLHDFINSLKIMLVLLQA